MKHVIFGYLVFHVFLSFYCRVVHAQYALLSCLVAYPSNGNWEHFLVHSWDVSSKSIDGLIYGYNKSKWFYIFQIITWFMSSPEFSSSESTRKFLTFYVWVSEWKTFLLSMLYVCIIGQFKMMLSFKTLRGNLIIFFY